MGVSWHEANAYAAWLTEHLRGRGLISGEQVVRLPTQAEWEQAARSTGGRASLGQRSTRPGPTQRKWLGADPGLDVS
ncbi:SUMF1/EgtB/PvdO family nonheme iron enzyme [Candidatus Amarolinea dominans]|uniref:SUMF1/EgtB/PvdO family nonheme iron enzyme n=1 Tax=Candidatus Amarolinea dominans TaxID=3140696 RepID=UPI0031CC9B15